MISAMTLANSRYVEALEGAYWEAALTLCDEALVTTYITLDTGSTLQMFPRTVRPSLEN
jgi:hypothetical protein